MAAGKAELAIPLLEKAITLLPDNSGLRIDLANAMIGLGRIDEAAAALRENIARRLIDFLGLPWDDACLRFYENDRTVTTPSRWQVRQPIYASSVRRWEKSGDSIQPLIDALGDLADL